MVEISLGCHVFQHANDSKRQDYWPDIRDALRQGQRALVLATDRLSESLATKLVVGAHDDFLACFGAFSNCARVTACLSAMLLWYSENLEALEICCARNEDPCWFFAMPLPDGVVKSIEVLVQPGPLLSWYQKTYPFAQFSNVKGVLAQAIPVGHRPQVVLYDDALRSRMLDTRHDDVVAGDELDSCYSLTELLLHEVAHLIGKFYTPDYDESLDVIDVELGIPTGRETHAYRSEGVVQLAAMQHYDTPRNPDSIAYFLLLTTLRKTGWQFPNWQAREMNEHQSLPLCLDCVEQRSSDEDKDNWKTDLVGSLGRTIKSAMARPFTYPMRWTS